MSVPAAIAFVIIACCIWSLMGVGLKAYFRRGMADKFPEFNGGEERLNRALLLKSIRGWIALTPLLVVVFSVDESTFSGNSSGWIFLLILGAFLLNYAVEALLNLLFPSQMLSDLSKWENERIRLHASQIEMRGDHSVPSDGVGRPKDLN